MASGFELVAEVEIDASPELVYRFFTEPELLERWHCVRAESDPRPGGRLVLDVTGAHVTRGEYLELEPGRRLVYTWGFDEPGSTTVEVLFEPRPGGTRVTLRHTGFQEATDRDGHRSGWGDYLKRLAIAAPGGDPGPDPRRVS